MSVLLFYQDYQDQTIFTPRGIRIPVYSVKRKRPWPLDDGGKKNSLVKLVEFVPILNARCALGVSSALGNSLLQMLF